MNNLRAYAIFSMQKSAINYIEHDTLDYYTEEGINKAVDLLWERAGYGELRPCHRGGHNRSKKSCTARICLMP